MNKTKDEEEIPLQDRLWPDEPQHTRQGENSLQNPHWNELPLTYRLWPDNDWPPQSLLDLPASKAIKHEMDRLFTKFYQQEKDNWD